MKINNFMKKHKHAVMLVCVAMVAVILVTHTLIATNILTAGSDSIKQGDLVPTSNINPRYNDIMQSGSQALTQDTSAMAENTVSSSTPATKAATTAPASTAAVATEKTDSSTSGTESMESVPFATAVKPQTPANYNDQWELGYLIAVDNPDKSYSCARINLTDEDRDLLERLCYGEFGSGGFIGASLIAQCVKDAMCFEGYKTVADVIRDCRYDGSTEIGTSDECRQAVRYIFDENHDAVQHRIMYMYNPYMVQSAFHESQNFILAYGGVRFFDRWG